jgi:hypothetical protein
MKNCCIFALAFGPVAQLNRVPHYGCGGSRFESWRGHQKENREILFFCIKYFDMKYFVYVLRTKNKGMPTAVKIRTKEHYSGQNQ